MSVLLCRQGRPWAEGRRKEAELERGQIPTGNATDLGTGSVQQSLGAAERLLQLIQSRMETRGGLSSWDAVAETV